jgi:endoglucanase
MKQWILYFSLFERCLVSLSVGLAMYSAAFGQTLPTAVESAKAMTLGWNLGNTLEAIGGETAWGNPAATQRLIDSVKAAGFTTIRIPCAWDNHADQTTGIIDAAWIARVKEVVDYCIKDSLYAIINIHWDNGWLENNCTADKKDAVNAKQKTYWTQIANYFKNYDGHLLFAGANEPSVADAAQMAVLMSYHQTFIDAVRATGGNNGSRVLLVQGPSTDIEKTNTLMNSLPADKIANHLIIEVHYYSPWNFTGMTKNESWGSMFYFWGKNNHSSTNTAYNPTWGEESYLDSCFKLMKTKFADKGIPVIIGEFGAMKRTALTGADLALHSKSRDYYHNYIAHTAVSRGIIPVYWDNGAAENALFNRTTGAVSDQGTLKALITGAGIGGNTAKIYSTTKGSSNHGSEILLNSSTKALKLTVAHPELVKSVSIFDQAGRRVKSLNNPAALGTTIFGSDFKAGVYIVQLNDNTGKPTHFFRVTKNR